MSSPALDRELRSKATALAACVFKLTTMREDDPRREPMLQRIAILKAETNIP
jgi:hypothetical protein